MTGTGDVDKAALLPWLRLHDGAVTGLSVRAEARRLLTVGLDGRVFVVPTDTEVSIYYGSSNVILRSAHLSPRAHISRLRSPSHDMVALQERSRPTAARVTNLRNHAWTQLRCNCETVVQNVSSTGCRCNAGWDLRGSALQWGQHGVVLDCCLVLARHLRDSRHDRCGSVCLTLPCPLLLMSTRCCNGLLMCYKGCNGLPSRCVAILASRAEHVDLHGAEGSRRRSKQNASGTQVASKCGT